MKIYNLKCQITLLLELIKLNLVLDSIRKFVVKNFVRKYKYASKCLVKVLVNGVGREREVRGSNIFFRFLLSFKSKQIPLFQLDFFVVQKYSH